MTKEVKGDKKDRNMDKQEFYIIGIREPSDTHIDHWVEEVTFRNHHFQEFKNTTIQFTDDMRYSLRLKSKELAEELAFVTQQTFPKMKIDVVLMDERWFRV